MRDAREASYRESDYTDDNPAVLEDLMDEDDTFFGFEGSRTFLGAVDYSIPPNDRMKVQFDTHTRMHYVRTGDIALARKRAWSDIKEKWSPTEIGAVLTGDGIDRKPRAMPYAPERVMAVSPAVARSRLEAFARDQDLDAEMLEIVSDDRTARDGSWAIYVIDEENDTLTFHPQRWVGADWAEEAKEFEWQKAVDEAIEGRKVQLDLQTEAEKARSDPFWLSKGLRDTRE